MNRSLKNKILSTIGAIVLFIVSAILSVISFKLVISIFELVKAWSGFDIIKALGVVIIFLVFATYALFTFFIGLALIISDEKL